jgi:hypothetical protein
MVMFRSRQYHVAGSADTSFDQQFQISGTTLILPEAVLESVFETIQAEMVRAARIGAIQKRTINASICHICLALALLPLIYIGGE